MVLYKVDGIMRVGLFKADGIIKLMIQDSGAGSDGLMRPRTDETTDHTNLTPSRH